MKKMVATSIIALAAQSANANSYTATYPKPHTQYNPKFVTKIYSENMTVSQGVYYSGTRYYPICIKNNYKQDSAYIEADEEYINRRGFFAWYRDRIFNKERLIRRLKYYDNKFQCNNETIQVKFSDDIRYKGLNILERNSNLNCSNNETLASTTKPLSTCKIDSITQNSKQPIYTQANMFLSVCVKKSYLDELNKKHLPQSVYSSLPRYDNFYQNNIKNSWEIKYSCSNKALTIPNTYRYNEINKSYHYRCNDDEVMLFHDSYRKSTSEAEEPINNNSCNEVKVIYNQYNSLPRGMVEL